MEFMMKSQKGVTLVALVIYIIVFTIVISILSVISSFFFSNVNFVKEQANYAPEFNKGEDIFSDFINISNINLYYEDKFEEYGITHVIVFKKAKLNLFLSRDNNYKQLYSDANFVLYERNIDN